MSLPTLVKTWQFSVNQIWGGTGNATTDTAHVLLQLKNTLIGFSTLPWTVRYSCNSVTAGTVGDGVDRWTTTANIVDGQQSGGVFSWMVLKQSGMSGGNAQILIAYLKSTIGNQGAWVITFSPNAGYTGGTTNTKPSATDEQLLIGASLTQGSGIMGASGYAQRTFRLHGAQAGDGTQTCIAYHENGICKIFLRFGELGSPTTGLTSPLFGIGLNASTSVPNYTNTYNTANSKGFSNSLSFTAFMSTESAQGGALGTKLTFAQDFDSNFVITPIALVTQTGGLRGRLGLVTDMWFGSTIISEGSTYPGDATRQFVQFGHIVLPWNGSIPQIV